MVTATRPVVLVVSPPGGASHSLAPRLSAAGYEPILVSNFASAKSALDQRPGLLIADVKLGAYNGLHLAIRAASFGTPAIVIGDSDPVLQADAERQQAFYLTMPLDADRAIALVMKLLDVALHTRRSARKQIPGLDAFVDDVHARVLDVSYDGMRIEAPQEVVLPPHFVVRLPQFNFTCRVERVWTGPAVSGSGAAGTWYGAAVSAADYATTSAWRALVDAMPTLEAMI